MLENTPYYLMITKPSAHRLLLAAAIAGTAANPTSARGRVAHL